MVNGESPAEICLTKRNEHPLPWLIAEKSNRTSVIRQCILSTVNIDNPTKECLTNRNELFRVQLSERSQARFGDTSVSLYRRTEAYQNVQ